MQTTPRSMLYGMTSYHPSQNPVSPSLRKYTRVDSLSHHIACGILVPYCQLGIESTFDKGCVVCLTLFLFDPNLLFNKLSGVLPYDLLIPNHLLIYSIQKPDGASYYCVYFIH